MRLPNLNALRMFDASARHLNFRLAAAELNVTQGAVAQQIRGLVTDLGEKLFHRLPRGLSLAGAGTRLHARIQDATAAFHSAPQYLRLSVPPSFAAKWLVPRLAGFQLAHLDINLDIVASETKAELGETADMAVRQGPAPSDPGVETHGFHILWSRGKTPSPAATLLRDWLLAQAQMQTQAPTPP